MSLTSYQITPPRKRFIFLGMAGFEPATSKLKA